MEDRKDEKGSKVKEWYINGTKPEVENVSYSPIKTGMIRLAATTKKCSSMLFTRRHLKP